MRYVLRTIPWVAILLACSACGDGRKACYPVRGQVLYGGKPASKAMVVFHPLDDKDPRAIRPRAHVESDGSFQLSSYDAYDGAPAGNYAVTVVWLKSAGQGEETEEEEEDEKPAVNALPEQYADPDKSQLRAEVKEGTNELPPFQLQHPKN